LGAETAPLGLSVCTDLATISPALTARKATDLIANAASIVSGPLTFGHGVQFGRAITASNKAVTLCVTSVGIVIARPHVRDVSPGHL